MALFHRKTPTAELPDQMFDLHRTLPNADFAGATAVAPPVSRSIPWRKIIKRTLLVILVIALGIGGWLGWKFYKDSSKAFNGNIFSIFSTTKLKGEAAGRVNILLIGNSADDPNHGGAMLTDSIMVISVDTATHKAFMLSIPRDLYVQIPGHGYAKINEAYQDGEADQAGTGATLLESVISARTGLSLQYYALIDYTAFRDAVNAVGGITINIQSSDPRGLYDSNIAKVDGGPLKLANGVQTLNGQTALNLARARGDGYYSYGFPGSDFDRTAHQRQMLLALKAKASSANVLSDPLKIGKLADAIGNNLKTDMTTAEAYRLYSLTKNIPESSITSASLNGPTGGALLKSYQTSTGESALIPKTGLNDYSAIMAYIQQLVAAN